MTTAPNPSPVNGADRCLFYGSYLLRASVLIHALALFIIVFQTRQTQFGVLLFMNWLSEFEDPYLAAVLVEKITVSLYLVAALVIVFKPYWPLLLFIAGYAFLEAYASAANSGFRYSEWSPAAQALRYGAPLVLLILVGAPKFEALRTWRLPLAVSLLRVFVAVVFFTHGYLALLGSPGFIDLIIGTSGNIFGARLSESAAVVLLKWIAVIDFCVALAVLVYPIPLLVPRSLWAGPCRICPIRRGILPGLMCWLALWGLVTALSRMTSLGLPTGLWQYPELLLRGSHFLGPLALWALFAAMMDRNRTTGKWE
ncbi:MAG: hypothetical protein ACNA77_07160 [Opitutales bacterium]